ncbi:MAG TPA: biotin/lipoyl-containing protein [Ramlibacter sp.]|nr:biotin/lipoyl-containing protein [Ramlibacter sp.]
MTDQQLNDVRRLSDWLAGTDITLLELTGPGRSIRLRRNGGEFTSAPEPEVQAPGEAPQGGPTVIRAGSVGVLLQAHPLRAEPLARVGQQVAAGQALALLKIGLVLLAVPAPRAGTVSRIVAPHEAPVGYGDVLIELR